MKVLAMRVDWKNYCPNAPTLVALVDRVPATAELRYRRSDSGLYVAVVDGFVSYLHWSGNGYDGGYNNAEIPVTLEDGTAVMLLGPWSSRPGCVNIDPAGFEHCLDVRIVDDPEAYREGRVPCVQAMTKAAVASALLEFLPEIELVRAGGSSEVDYAPTFKGMSVRESKAASKLAG